MRKLAVVALAVFLAGCSARGIITGEEQVVVQAWTHSMAVTFAEGECARYGRNAVLVGSNLETYVFDCRKAEIVQAVQVPRTPDPATQMPPPVARAPDARPPPPQPINRAPPPPQSTQRAPPPSPKPQPAPVAAAQRAPPPSPKPQPPPVAAAPPPPPALAATAAPPPVRQAASPVVPAPAAPKAQPGWWVQVAADRTRKEAEATGRRVKKNFAGLLNQRKYRIEKVTVRDIGVYYRSRFGPYPGRTAAADACRAMKKRKQSCIIAR